MRGTWHLFTYKQIPVKVHWSFLLILGWFGYVALSEDLSAEETGWLIVLVFAMFSFVVMHEFGHALAALRYGVHTRDIVLLPIGGMARLERIPENPKQELVIALAGPFVNVGLAFLLLLVIWFFGIGSFIEIKEQLDGLLTFKGVIVLLFVMNIGLFVFNLIPAFPMDGGRVFRALLSMRTSREIATKWASSVGQILAIVFFIYGSSVQHYGLMMIGVFIFFAAKMEYESIKRNSKVEPSDSLPLIPIRQVYRSSFKHYSPEAEMLGPIQAFIRGEDPAFLIREDTTGHFLGVLSSDQILKAIEACKENEPIRSFYDPGVLRLDVHLSAREALSLMRSSIYQIALVTDEEQPVGVVDEAALRRAILLAKRCIQ